MSPDQDNDVALEQIEADLPSIEDDDREAQRALATTSGLMDGMDDEQTAETLARIQTCDADELDRIVEESDDADGNGRVVNTEARRERLRRRRQG